MECPLRANRWNIVSNAPAVTGEPNHRYMFLLMRTFSKFKDRKAGAGGGI
jgi:hypothetical protein